MSDQRVRQSQRLFATGEIDSSEFFRRMLRLGVLCVGARIETHRAWGGLHPGVWEIVALNEGNYALELRKVGKRGGVLTRGRGKWYRFNKANHTIPDVLVRLEATILARTRELGVQVAKERLREEREAKRTKNSQYREFLIRQTICGCVNYGWYRHDPGCNGWKTRFVARVMAQSKRKAINAFVREYPKAPLSPWGLLVAIDTAHDDRVYGGLPTQTASANLPRIQGN